MTIIEVKKDLILFNGCKFVSFSAYDEVVTAFIVTEDEKEIGETFFTLNEGDPFEEEVTEEFVFSKLQTRKFSFQWDDNTK